MSFLDESASLLDALAFLDAYEGPSPRHETSSSSSVGAPSSPEQEPQRKSRSSTTTAAPKLRHRDRMKAETLRLQREAEALEATLAKLQANAQAFDTQALERWRGPDSTGSKWKEVVVHEYRSRRRSEITNRKLKVLLAKQLKMVKSSEGFLQSKMEEEVRWSFLGRVCQATDPLSSYSGPGSAVRCAEGHEAHEPNSRGGFYQGDAGLTSAPAQAQRGQAHDRDRPRV